MQDATKTFFINLTSYLYWAREVTWITCEASDLVMRVQIPSGPLTFFHKNALVIKTAKTLPLGKIKADLLESLLKRYPGAEDGRLVVGPKIGEDAAVIDFGDRYVVVKTDPVTFAADEIGWYAINVNANDLATRGARPRWFQSAILLPEGKTTEELVEKIFSQVSHACRELGIAIVGGHTEVSYNLHRPIVIGCMLGEVEKDKLVTTSGAKPGDDILLTKGIVIEGTSIIAREKEMDLRRKGYPEGFIKKCKDYLRNPGISMVRDALLANEAVKVHCMHDPTEGGLATGLYEIARASGVGLKIHRDRIFFLDESKVLCREYGLDALGTITSGTLVLTVDPKESGKLLEVYEKAGIRASIIGKIREKNYGIRIETKGKVEELKHSEKDEITRIFE